MGFDVLWIYLPWLIVVLNGGTEHTCGNRCPCLREKKLSPSRSDFRDCRLVKASNRLKTGCQKPAGMLLCLNPFFPPFYACREHHKELVRRVYVSGEWHGAD